MLLNAALLQGDCRVTDGAALLSADAAGALVVALEDEFWQVRAAAIESMGQLALSSRTFRSKCLESLTGPRDSQKGFRVQGLVFRVLGLGLRA